MTAGHEHRTARPGGGPEPSGTGSGTLRNPPEPPPTGDLLTAAQAAQLAGVSERALRKRIDTLPAWMHVPRKLDANRAQTTVKSALPHT